MSVSHAVSGTVSHSHKAINPAADSSLVYCAIKGRTAAGAENPWLPVRPRKTRAKVDFDFILGQRASVPNFGVLNVYENEIEVKRPGVSTRTPKPSQRGQIKDFSDRSQFRLRQKLNRLRWPAGPCYFTTLTVPDEWQFNPEALRQALKSLWKRVQRRYPGAAWLWRREWKFRKSGEYVGELRAHYHLFVFGITADECEFWDFIRWAWWELVGEGNIDALMVGTDVKTVHERKQAQAYISKYMSKSESNAALEGESVGRAWGVRGELDFSPLLSVKLSLIALAVLQRRIHIWLIEHGSAFLWKLLEYPDRLGYHVWGVGQDWQILTAGLSPPLRNENPGDL